MSDEKIVLSFDTDVEIDEKSEVFLDERNNGLEDRFSISNLSDDEKKMVEDFSNQIDITNSHQILNYGAGVQKKLSDFSNQTLNTVRTKDLGEVGNMISNLVVELNDFDKSDEGGILGFFKKGVKNTQVMKAKYDRAEVNVNSIVKSLESQQMDLMKDIAMLDQMYELNKNYYKEISMYILAGKKKLNYINSTDLPLLISKADSTNLPEDAQNLNDLKNNINRFEKKLADLDLTRMIAIQTAPQIRMIQNNNVEIVDKIQSTIVNTIPLWKNQMVLALGVTRSLNAVKTQKEISDVTNKLLRKNADTLKMSSIEVAKESERPIVDVDTIKYTNQVLISSLDEVLKIQSEGRVKRQEAEKEIKILESELKQKMVEMSKK